MNNPALLDYVVEVFYRGNGIATKVPVNFSSTYFPLAALAAVIVIVSCTIRSYCALTHCIVTQVKNAISEWKTGEHCPIPLGDAASVACAWWLTVIQGLEVDEYHGPRLRQTQSRIVQDGL